MTTATLTWSTLRLSNLPLVAMTLATTVTAAVTLTACGTEDSGPVTVPPASPTATKSVEACARLGGGLPTAVLEQPQRPTVPDSPTTAAWGDPAITLTCGVPRPDARAPGAQLFEIDGITWFAEELTAGTRFTSEDRAANVQVDVPDDYRPEAEALIDLAPAISASIPPAG